MDFRWTHAIAMWQAPPLSAQRPAARGWPSTAGARCSCNPGFHPIPLSARDMRLRQVLRHLTPCCQGPAAMCCAGHGRHLLRACMQVVLTFSMQGVGNFVNVAVLCILFPIFDTVKPDRHNKLYPYHTKRCICSCLAAATQASLWKSVAMRRTPLALLPAQPEACVRRLSGHGAWVESQTGVHSSAALRPCRLSGLWRTAFAVAVPVILFIVFWRIFKLRESAVWAARKPQSQARSFKLMLYHFWHRHALQGPLTRSSWPFLCGPLPSQPAVLRSHPVAVCLRLRFHGCSAAGCWQREARGSSGTTPSMATRPALRPMQSSLHSCRASPRIFVIAWLLTAWRLTHACYSARRSSNRSSSRSFRLVTLCVVRPSGILATDCHAG